MVIVTTLQCIKTSFKTIYLFVFVVVVSFFFSKQNQADKKCSLVATVYMTPSIQYAALWFLAMFPEMTSLRQHDYI